MLTLTKQAAALLKIARAEEGVGSAAGVRIVMPSESGIPLGFSFSDESDLGDEEFEQQGMRIFVQNALVESLDGLTLDVHYDKVGPELILR
jgi:Fe-S cluster assembly iron-binding protein IscA